MDVRRFVRPNADWSTVTTVLDLETAPARQTVRDTWTVTPPPRKPQQATDERRYGGSRPVGETHDNGSLAWTTLVGGASANAAIDNMRALLAQLEQVQPGLYLEWRPDGASSSVFYEVRGPAVWKLSYTWAQFAAVYSLTCEVQLPVAPLAVSAPMVIGPFTQDLPAVIPLDQTIPGDAPALLTAKLAVAGSANNPAWGLIAWTRRPTGGGADPAPFAVLTDDLYVGTNGYLHGIGRSNAALSTSAATSFTVNTTRIPHDPFSGELMVEVWGRFENNSAITDARAVLRSGHSVSYAPSPEFGEAGCPIPRPTSGTVFRMVRLGTVVLASDFPFIAVDFSWSTASGYIGLDYLIAIPVAQRAVGATAKPLDASYPALFPTGASGTHQKAILPDLSGKIGAGTLAAAALPPFPHTGLGGCPMEIPPGDVDLLVALSSLVPDDPTVDASSETSGYAGVAITAIVQPRWFLARGT